MMECRAGCGACCIAISISSSIPGMPHGKPAGVRCIQLTEDNRCKIFGESERPQTCLKFHAEKEICGFSTAEAITLLTELEEYTAA